MVVLLATQKGRPALPSGNPDSRGRPYTDAELASGDLFVFGGPSRIAYHGGAEDPAGDG